MSDTTTDTTTTDEEHADDPPAPPPPAPADTDTEDEPDDDKRRQRGDADGLRADLRRTRDRLRQRETELEQLRQTTMTEGQRAIAEARAEGEKNASEKLQRRLVVSEITSQAAGRMANPKLAARLLDVDNFLPDSIDDDVDEDAITEAITTLLDENPYLAGEKPSESDGKRRTPRVPGGPRDSDRPGQLTRADLATMSHQEIEKARREGRLTKMLRQEPTKT